MEKIILLVEDNYDDQLFILENLKQQGLHFMNCVADGAAALQFLEQNPAPSVILLDLSLPKISGLDVLQKIRSNEKTKYIPVVVLSSSKEDTDIKRAYELGCNSYLYKPIVYEKLRDLIGLIAAYWCAQNISYENGAASEMTQEEQ